MDSTQGSRLDCLVYEGCQKVELLVKKAMQNRDGSRKERRHFDVRTAGCLAERLVYHVAPHTASAYGFRSYATSRSFSGFPRVAGIQFNRTANLLLNPLYNVLEHLREPTDSILPVRLSHKVMIDGRSLHDIAQQRLRVISAGNGNTAVTLSQLSVSLGGEAPLEFLESDTTVVDHAFFTDLAEIALDAIEGPVTTETMHDFQSRHPRSLCSELKEREYFNRGDVRAFVVFADVIGSLTGSVLQAIYRPKAMWLRKKLEFTKHYPARAANLLRVEVGASEGDHVTTVTGDISGFTFSNVNGWIVVLVTMLELCKNENVSHLLRSFPICVCGYPMEVDILSVMATYLFLTVFRPVHDNSLDELYSAPGGSLGVPGNNVMTMFSFDMTLRDLGEHCRGFQAQLRVQLGGDDFNLIIIAPVLAMDSCVSLLIRTLTREVGHLKECAVTYMDHHQDNGCFVLSQQFCKKDVEVRLTLGSSGRVCRLTSMYGIPLMSQLFERLGEGSVKQSRIELRDFLTSVWSALTPFGDLRPALLNIYHDAFRSVHPFDGIAAEWSAPRAVSPEDASNLAETDDNVLIFPNAMASILAAPDISGSEGRVYRTSLSDKRSFRLATDKLQCVSTRYLADAPDVVRQVVGTKRELARLLASPREEYADLCRYHYYHTQSKILTECLLDARRALGALERGEVDYD